MFQCQSNVYTGGEETIVSVWLVRVAGGRRGAGGTARLWCNGAARVGSMCSKGAVPGGWSGKVRGFVGNRGLVIGNNGGVEAEAEELDWSVVTFGVCRALLIGSDVLELCAGLLSPGWLLVIFGESRGLIMGNGLEPEAEELDWLLNEGVGSGVRGGLRIGNIGATSA